MLTQTGFQPFRAPELVTNTGEYSENVDIWSLGGCIYYMLCGYLPFPQEQ